MTVFIDGEGCLRLFGLLRVPKTIFLSKDKQEGIKKEGKKKRRKEERKEEKRKGDTNREGRRERVMDGKNKGKEEKKK